MCSSLAEVNTTKYIKHMYIIKPRIPRVGTEIDNMHKKLDTRISVTAVLIQPKKNLGTQNVENRSFKKQMQYNHMMEF